MEEIEVPTEHLHEHIKEEAEKAVGPEHDAAHHDRQHAALTIRVALSSAVIAVVAAIAALLAGHHANEAVIEQMRATDQWSFFQAKSIKVTVLSATSDLLVSLGKAPKAEDLARIEGYRKEQAVIEEKAREQERSTAEHLRHYKTLAHAVTLSQVGIALAAMAVLTRRKLLWYLSLLLGVAGLFFLVTGVL